MTITVQGPNGITIDFPDGTDHATINGVMSQALGAKASAPPDKYQQAAIDEQAALKEKGIDEGAGLTRRLAHGATLGADSTLLAAALSPVEAIRRGVGLGEGYNYAKAREDQIMGDARKNTGGLGTAAEVLGGGIAGAGLANAGVTAARALAPEAGLLARSGAAAADAAGLGGFSGAMEGNGVSERFNNALKGAAIGGAVGGLTPGALALAGGAVSPIVSNIRARINPEGYAQSQVARAIHESGASPVELENRVQQAVLEGQGVFNVADAMGNAGQRMLSTVARAPGEGRTAVVNALEARQADQGRRVSNALAEGFQAPQTAAQARAGMTTARDAAADTEYSAVRGGAGQVDVVPAINAIDRTIGTGPGQALQATNDSIEGAMRPFRERLARVNPDDFEAVSRIRSDMADAAQNARQTGYGNRARLIGQAVRELDTAMEAASPGYRQANANFRQRSRDIEAIDTGRQAATRGRPEDTIPTFQAQSPAGQNAFRTGYVDPLIEQVQGSAVGVNKARPFTSDAFQAEAAALNPAPPAPPRATGIATINGQDYHMVPGLRPAAWPRVIPSRNELMQRRIGREQTMFETRAQALGGSKTADNLADQAAMGVDPHLVSQIVTGNWHGALRSALAAGHSALTGNTPQVRREVANILLRNGTNLTPGQLRDMVQNTVARIQFVQNIARNLGRGAAGGLAISTPSGQRRNH